MGGEKADMVFTDHRIGLMSFPTTVGGGSCGSDGAGNVVDANRYAKIIGDDTTKPLSRFITCVSVLVITILLCGEEITSLAFCHRQRGELSGQKGP